VNTSGDGFLAIFDGPQRAIRCAMAIHDAVRTLGIEVRAGLHTGECEIRGDYTPVSAKSAAMTSVALLCTSAPASAPWQSRTTCSSQARCTTS
jgi:class 3 adenylate cyclase